MTAALSIQCQTRSQRLRLLSSFLWEMITVNSCLHWGSIWLTSKATFPDRIWSISCCQAWWSKSLRCLTTMQCSSHMELRSSHPNSGFGQRRSCLQTKAGRKSMLWLLINLIQGSSTCIWDQRSTYQKVQWSNKWQLHSHPYWAPSHRAQFTPAKM